VIGNLTKEPSHQNKSHNDGDNKKQPIKYFVHRKFSHTESLTENIRNRQIRLS
jgi:hypothetical protein